jgi:4a-hydroxytetrahydrobiopterin dehydratase
MSRGMDRFFYFYTMWQENNNALYRCFEFSDFTTAFAFITRVALLAEKHQHHPQWSNNWNKVEIRLTTFEAGNVITEKDRLLAAEIDKIALSNQA